MTANFGELLNKQVDSVEAPPVFPAGSYTAMTGKVSFGESSKKGTPFARFPVKLLGPGPDVDPDDFETAGGMAKLQARKPLNYDFYLTDDAFFLLRQFLENSLGLDCDGRTFDQVLPESENLEFVAVIGHRQGQQPGQQFMEVTGHAKAGDD